MSFGKAIDAADAILTTLVLIPFILALLVPINNIGNPNFDMTEAVSAILLDLGHSFEPDLGVLFIIAAIIYLIMWSRQGW
jgi:hypothetical protein